MSKGGKTKLVSHFWRAHTSKSRKRRGRRRRRRRRKRRRRRRRKVWNLLSFVWNLYGNYDSGIDYWTFGLLYGIV